MLTVWSWEAERELFMERSAVGRQGGYRISSVQGSLTCPPPSGESGEELRGTRPAEYHQRPLCASGCLSACSELILQTDRQTDPQSVF